MSKTPERKEQNINLPSSVYRAVLEKIAELSQTHPGNFILDNLDYIRVQRPENSPRLVEGLTISYFITDDRNKKQADIGTAIYSESEGKTADFIFLSEATVSVLRQNPAPWYVVHLEKQTLKDKTREKVSYEPPTKIDIPKPIKKRPQYSPIEIGEGTTITPIAKHTKRRLEEKKKQIEKEKIQKEERQRQNAIRERKAREKGWLLPPQH